MPVPIVPEPTIPTFMPGILIESYVLEVERLRVDAARGRRDPVRELAGLDDRLRHQAPHVLAIGGRGQELVLATAELRLADVVAVEIEELPGERADAAMKALRRQAELDAEIGDDLVPLLERRLAILDVSVSHLEVDRHARRDLALDDAPVLEELEL